MRKQKIIISDKFIGFQTDDLNQALNIDNMPKRSINEIDPINDVELSIQKLIQKSDHTILILESYYM